MVRLFLLYVLLLVSGPVILSAQDSTAADREILSVLNKQQISWNNGSIPGYMEGYWRSDSLLFTSGGKIQRGWNATLEKYLKRYATRTEMGRLEFSGLSVSFLSADAAWVFGNWSLTRAKDRPHGVFTLILRRFPEGWKIVHDHTSSE
jgi:ketosteroid isomerase-like protein